MIPTPADLRLLRRFEPANHWELAVHGAGHLVVAGIHLDRPVGELRGSSHLDPVGHIRTILESRSLTTRDRAVVLLAGYAANEVARDEFRGPADLTFAVHPDDHDGTHLLATVVHLPDTSAERFLLEAAAEAAELVRDRWAMVETIAAELHADARPFQPGVDAGSVTSGLGQQR